MPVLEPHQAAVMEAFFLLAPDRPVGGMGGIGAIPTTAILAMAEAIGEDPLIFLALCRILDGAYMERINSMKK